MSSRIRGQRFDGAYNMQGELNGLQAGMKKKKPFELYFYCFAYMLNLATRAIAKKFFWFLGFLGFFFTLATLCYGVII